MAGISLDVSKLYHMYLDSTQHSLLTGGGKAKFSAKTGINFSAWDGYIIGKNLEPKEKGKGKRWRVEEERKRITFYLTVGNSSARVGAQRRP